MAKRVVVVFLLALLAGVGASSAPAVAVESPAPTGEEEGPPPTEEILEQSGDFAPEQYEPPPFFRFILFPLLIVAVIAVLVVLFLYLVWAPRFGRERREKTKRR